MDRSLILTLLGVMLSAHGCGPEIAFAPAQREAYEAFGAPTDAPPSRLSGLAHSALVDSIRRGECVEYVRLDADPEARALARRTLAELASVNTAGLADGAERVAFWINAYNALVMVALADALASRPSATVSDDGFGLLRTPVATVAGHPMAPDWIHHGILRGDERHVSLAGIDEATWAFLRAQSAAAIAEVDPRIHFALACGAESCPRLPAVPYTGLTLDGDLDAAAARYLIDPTRGAGPGGVSPIFRWYPDDFAADGGFQRFLARYRSYEEAARSQTLGWDWRPLVSRPDDPRCAPREGAPTDGDPIPPDEMGPVRECAESAAQPCGPTATRGICRPGTQGCVEGRWGECVGAVEGRDERCDGQDEDCDGEVDEGVESASEEIDCPTAGLCAAGATVCRNGAWLCERPQAYVDRETNCDGVDDDCDGQVDEAATAPPDLAACSGPGECASASAACDGGAWTCVGYGAGYEPDGETRCDGLDNDCDALIDERLPQCVCANGATRDCGVGIGACTVGQQVCRGGLWGPCDGALPQPERCDALDNDCNGVVDDGVANACGACGPVPVESCDGVDNDCDGLVDEGVTHSCGACGRQPIETCNGSDDDCDGRVDEGVANACGGCGGPVEERCNGLDDDCDGEVDEGLSPPADLQCGGVGVCARGEAACLGAEGYGCRYPATHEREERSCDFRDNDCDGLTDEGLLNSCDFCGPDPTENCNHLDDDCDGQEDEGCPIDPNSQPVRD